MWQFFVGLIEDGLLFFNDVLANFGVPYSFGFAIILFTVVVKLATFPLNQKQIKASKAQQDLQPKLKALQKKHGDDREAMAKAQMELYKEHGVNPLGGCLPTLVQMPIWFGLYRALFQLVGRPETPLKEGFFWIPSLSGPVKPITAGFTGGIDWLMPNSPEFLGWGQAIAYLILPVFLVVSQLYTQRMMMPKTDDPQQKMMGQVMSFMPLMFGYISLVVPSGLTLYWFTNNVLTMVQQYSTLKDRQRNEKQADDDEKTEEVILGEENRVTGTQLEVSPATAAIENLSDSKEQVKTHARRRSKSKKRRKRKK